VRSLVARKIGWLPRKSARPGPFSSLIDLIFTGPSMPTFDFVVDEIESPEHGRIRAAGQS
jgi:hypothetical protein